MGLTLIGVKYVLLQHFPGNIVTTLVHPVNFVFSFNYPICKLWCGITSTINEILELIIWTRMVLCKTILNGYPIPTPLSVLHAIVEGPMSQIFYRS